MKIAELYVILGFHVEGAEALQMMEKDLDTAASKAGKLAAGIDVMTAGLLYMMNTAVNAAVGMSQFSLATGLSTTELQQWQHTAAIANISGDEMQKTIMALQEVHTQLMLGGNASPWLLLGINPNQNPMEIFRQLHSYLVGLSGDQLTTARVLMKQAGFDDKMFATFRRSDLPIDALTEQYILTQKNASELLDLNVGWNDLADRATRVKNIFSSEMTGPFKELIKILRKALDHLADFVHWLGSGSEAANATKLAIEILGDSVVALGGFLTGVAVILKGVSFAFGGLELAMVPVAAVMLNTMAVVLGLGFAVWKLVEAYQALDAMEAAKALEKRTGTDADDADRRLAQSRRDRGLAPLTPHQRAADKLLDEKPAQRKRRERLAEHPVGSMWSNSRLSDQMSVGAYPDETPSPRDLLGHAAPSTTTNNSPTTVNIDKVQIDGHQYNDASALARGFVESLKQSLAAAGAMAPAKSQ